MFFCSFDRSSESCWRSSASLSRSCILAIMSCRSTLLLSFDAESPEPESFCWLASLLIRPACSRSSCDRRPASCAIESTLPDASCCCVPARRFVASRSRSAACCEESEFCPGVPPLRFIASVACCRRLSACVIRWSEDWLGDWPEDWPDDEPEDELGDCPLACLRADCEPLWPWEALCDDEFCWEFCWLEEDADEPPESCWPCWPFCAICSICRCS